MTKKIIVIDLDGTLLNTNTFHKWLIFLFKKSLYLNPLDSMKILYIVFLRGLKKITHKEMKYNILKISESKKYTKHIKPFVKKMDKYINSEVKSYVDGNNTITILATAAPELYAQEIANAYNFDYCVATPSTNIKQWYENIQENKKLSLEQLLHKINIKGIDVVFSDHHDDLPIMKLASSVYLVNASSDTKERLLDEKIAFIEI